MRGGRQELFRWLKADEEAFWVLGSGMGLPKSVAPSGEAHSAIVQLSFPSPPPLSFFWGGSHTWWLLRVDSLALHLGITSDCSGKTYGMLGIEPRLGCVQGKRPAHWIITPAPRKICIGHGATEGGVACPAFHPLPTLSLLGWSLAREPSSRQV